MQLIEYIKLCFKSAEKSVLSGIGRSDASDENSPKGVIVE
jgi:hypothetical protein